MTDTVDTFPKKKQFSIRLAAGTLALTMPFGKTLLLTLAFFVLFYLGGEFLARTKFMQTFIIRQTWNSRHIPFERQLSRLHTLAAQEGAPDCIFLGNSMVWLGFDPEAFQEGYQRKTGDTLRCFNFGVDGMPASNAGVLAEILIADFHPSLLIYGADARDLAVPADAEDAQVLSEMAWWKYRSGKYAPAGWFIEHSYLYRFRPALKRLFRMDDQYTKFGDWDKSTAQRYGFDPVERVGDIQNSPDPNDPDMHIQYYYSLLSEYIIHAENLAGLQQVLRAGKMEGEIVLVEMPVPDTYVDFMGNGEEDYREFIKTVDLAANSNQVLFLRARSWNVVPQDGWVDYSHLNAKGAKIFSRTLGEKIGEAVRTGKIHIPRK